MDVVQGPFGGRLASICRMTIAAPEVRPRMVLVQERACRADGDGRSARGKLCRGDVQPCGCRSGVQPPVPGGDDEVWVSEGQSAGQVHRVGAAQGVGAGELPGMAFDGCGEFDRAYRGPVLLPCLLGYVQVIVAEVVVAAGCGQRGADLGVGEPAGQGRPAN